MAVGMRRAFLMGDPLHWGARGRADRAEARREWRDLHDLLRDLGAATIVIAPQLAHPDLALPATLGFLTPLDAEKPLSEKRFVLANAAPARSGSRRHVRQLLAQYGFRVEGLDERFHVEGGADFFPAGDPYVLALGGAEPPRLVVALGVPPWRRVPGTQPASPAAEPVLRALVAPRPVLRVALAPRRIGRGDTALCAFGPGRRHLLVHAASLAPEGLALLRDVFHDRVVEIDDADAARGAAGALALQLGAECMLVMPEGVSERLRGEVKERGATPLAAPFRALARGAGGALRRLALDLGPVAADRLAIAAPPAEPLAAAAQAPARTMPAVAAGAPSAAPAAATARPGDGVRLGEAPGPETGTAPS